MYEQNVIKRYNVIKQTLKDLYKLVSDLEIQTRTDPDYYTWRTGAQKVHKLLIMNYSYIILNDPTRARAQEKAKLKTN